jgi:hypothetical protein
LWDVNDLRRAIAGTLVTPEEIFRLQHSHGLRSVASASGSSGSDLAQARSSAGRKRTGDRPAPHPSFAVRCGADTDTLGAMTGAIAGARQARR